MRIEKYFCGGVLLLMSLSAQAIAADEKTFAIKFERPAKVGQHFGFVATETVRTRQKIDLPDGGGNTTENIKRVSLEADVRIDQLDDKGRESLQTLVIKSLSIQLNDQTTPLLTAGTELLVDFKGPQMVFTQKSGAKLPDEADAGLRQIFKAQREQKINYDSIFGSREMKKVGDSWPVAPGDLATDIQVPGAIDPEQVKGTVTLKGIEKIAGTECARIEATLTIQNVPIEGTQAKESTMTLTLVSNQPTDITKPIASSNTRSITHMVVEQQPNGRSVVRYTIDSETTHAATWTPKP